MKPPTLFIACPQKHRGHPLLERLLNDLVSRAGASFHLHSQKPGRSSEDPAVAVSKFGIHDSELFIYILSRASNAERWANSEPCLQYARQVFGEAEGRIITVKIHNAIPPKILRRGICIDLTKDYEAGFTSLLRLLHTVYDSLRRQREDVGDKWVAAYYPSDVISEQRSRAIASLLFDKIICHFPIQSTTSCGGGAGVSNLVLEDDALVEAGIIEPREEILYSNVGENLSWDNEFDTFYKLQITAMALDVCSISKAVPVTDDADWPIPAAMVRHIDLSRAAHLQAATLAIQSLDITLPPFGDVSDAEILQARQDLEEQLIPFRRAMLCLAPAVRSGIESDSSVIDIAREAKYIVETQITPALGELRYRLEKERGKFWKRLLLQSSTILPKVILNWVAKDPLSAIVDAVGTSKDLLLETTEHIHLANSLRVQGGLGYLLSAGEHKSFKSRVADKPE